MRLTPGITSFESITEARTIRLLQRNEDGTSKRAENVSPSDCTLVVIRTNSFAFRKLAVAMVAMDLLRRWVWEEVRTKREEKSYRPWDFYERDPRVKRVVDSFSSNLFCPDEPNLFAWIFSNAAADFANNAIAPASSFASCFSPPCAR